MWNAKTTSTIINPKASQISFHDEIVRRRLQPQEASTTAAIKKRASPTASLSPESSAQSLTSAVAHPEDDNDDDDDDDDSSYWAPPKHSCGDIVEREVRSVLTSVVDYHKAYPSNQSVRLTTPEEEDPEESDFDWVPTSHLSSKEQTTAARIDFTGTVQMVREIQAKKTRKRIQQHLKNMTDISNQQRLQSDLNFSDDPWTLPPETEEEEEVESASESEEESSSDSANESEEESSSDSASRADEEEENGEYENKQRDEEYNIMENRQVQVVHLDGQLKPQQSSRPSGGSPNAFQKSLSDQNKGSPGVLKAPNDNTDLGSSSDSNNSKLAEQVGRGRDDSLSKPKSHRGILLGLIVAATVIVFLVVFLVLRFRENDDDVKNPPTPNGPTPSTPPPSSPTITNPPSPPPIIGDESTLLDIILALSPEMSDVMDDPSSSQRQAYDWLTKEDPFYNQYDIYRQVQRYVPAVVFYETNGLDWSNRDLWISAIHECDWYTSHPVQDICTTDDILMGLDLHSNNLEGNVPWLELSLLSTQIKKINLNNNFLVGPIDQNIGKLTRLESLDLQENQFTGKIPNQIGKLVKLKEMLLGDNQLSGTLPTQLSRMEALQYIQLENTFLEGSIPSELGLLTNLRQVYLKGNNFGGNMPSEICELDLDVLEVDCHLVECICCTNCGDGGDQSLMQMILSAYPQGEDSLKDHSSPQHAAYGWLLQDTKQNLNLPNDRILQRYALATLYYSTNGDSWSVSNNWLSSQNECTWYTSFVGYVCDSENHYMELDLQGNNLKGSLPMEILMLSQTLGEC